MHNASVVQLGTTQSSFRQIDNVAADPATFAAGLAMVSKADGTFSTTLSQGSLIGISMGRDESNTKRTPVIRRGIRVPIQLQAGFTTPNMGDPVQLHATSGKADATGTAVNAIYASPMLSGRDEDGNTVNCALIDFPGGL